MSSENISSNQESPNHNDGDDNENVSYLSPYGGTPPRTMSSHSLIGEDITQMDAEISPFTPSESTTPPRSHQMLPPSLSPPPLSVNSDVQFHDDQHYHYLQQQHSVQSAASSYNKQPTVPGNNSNTRPPRIPQISLPSRGTDPPRGHGRVHSTASADYSFLSALTDSSSETTVPKRRTVSFDMNDSTFNNRRAGDAAISSPGAMTTPASILQPILLEDTKHDVTPPASIVTANVKKFEETEPQNTASLGQSVATSTKVTNSESNNSLTGQPINNKMDWGVPVVDTGSFVRTSSEFEKYSELNTPTSTQMLQQHYSLTDVIDATPGDAQDEVDFLSSLESQGLRRNSKENPSLFPFVTDNRIHDFEEQNDEQTDPEKTPDVYIEHHRKETRNDLSFLMKRLADASPPQLDKTTSVPATGFVEIATKLFSSRSTSSHTKHVSKGDLESGEETQRPDPENDGDHGPARSRPYFRIFRRLKEDADYFLDFMEPQTVSIRKSFYSGLKYFMIPCLGIALLLYYGLGNPPESAGDEKPSSSWWLLFLGVRQVITLYMARISEIVVIDFLIFRTKLVPRLLGTPVSLTIAQAKGWPAQLFGWGLIDFIMLWGDRRFAKHWFYWQDIIRMMNATNPSGNITHSNIYLRVLCSAIGLGFAVTLKRGIFGQLVGKRVVRNYRTKLESMMKKLVLLTEVGYLSSRPRLASPPKIVGRLDSEALDDEAFLQGSGLSTQAQGNVDAKDSFDYSEAPLSNQTTNTLDKNINMFSSGDMGNEISEMLEEWEEPELQDLDVDEVDVSAVLQFRKAINFISDEFPFSPSFGRALTRQQCVQSSQRVFEGLTKESSHQILNFDTLCHIARLPDGSLDKLKVKELVRLFRPNRSGQLTKLEFVKSVDSVYKSLRLLLASIHSSSQIDQAYESLVNFAFYTVAFFVILTVTGVDTNAMFIGLSGLLVSFAFMIGSASSKYVEGILFIFARRPYDIGDRIEVSAATQEIDSNGPKNGWIVEKVNLYSTTVRLGTTREMATFSNGSLSGLRIVNLKRSEKPNIFMYLKFGVDVSTEQIESFRVRLTEYVKQRPREWIRLIGFRCTRVEADLGFMEYVIIIQHREAWQNLSAVLESKSDVFSFGLQAQKDLNMRYTAPAMPIEMSQTGISSLRSRFGGASSPTVGESFEDKKEK